MERRIYLMEERTDMLSYEVDDGEVQERLYEQVKHRLNTVEQ